MSLPHIPPSLQTCPFTDEEMAWLWPRYQRCTFPPASFPKRFARHDLTRLTAKGRTAAAQLAYQYRRQIFSKKAAKWDPAHFINAVKTAAAKPLPPIP
jgi:hypothetical protein